MYQGLHALRVDLFLLLLLPVALFVEILDFCGIKFRHPQAWKSGGIRIRTKISYILLNSSLFNQAIIFFTINWNASHYLSFLQVENEPFVSSIAWPFVSIPRHEPPGEHYTFLKELIDAQESCIRSTQVFQDIVAVCAGLLDSVYTVYIWFHTHQRCLLVEWKLEILPNPVLQGNAYAKLVSQRILIDLVVLEEELLVEAEDPIFMHALDKVFQLVNAWTALNHVVGKCYSVVQSGDHLAARSLEYAHDRVSLLYSCVLDVGDLHEPIMRKHNLICIVVELRGDDSFVEEFIRWRLDLLQCPEMLSFCEFVW